MNTQATETAATLKSILVGEMDLGLEAEKVTLTVPLFEGGLDLDSIVIVELISIVEDRFGIVFEDEDLRTSSFENISILAAVIDKRRQAGTS